MTRTIYFGTLHEPCLAHEIAFDSYAVAKNQRASTPNIATVEAAYFGANGRLLARETLDHLAPVTPLRGDFDIPGLVMLRIGYRSVLPFNVYGFVVRRDSGDGVMYPVSPAVGWPETTVWLNRGVMPTGSPPEGWRHEVFVGNPSRWAELRFKLILYSGGVRRTVALSLSPKQSIFIPIESLARELGFAQATEAVGVVSRNNAAVYVLGRDEATGALSFVEHLINYPRTNFRIAAPDERDHDESMQSGPLDRVFCYCNGMTLREALAHERQARVGNYCTGCRDDLRFARNAMMANPGILGQEELIT